MSDSHANDESDDGSHDHHAHDESDDGSHDHHAHDAGSVSVAIVTISTSRTSDDDPSGDRMIELFEAAGHTIVVRELVRDEYDSVQGAVDRLARRSDTDVVVTAGGTGVTPDDVTPGAVTGLFEKQLPGFGELFRRLSYAEIGTRTIGSRATAGVLEHTLVFCLPGSYNAVELGVQEIILPEVRHLVGLATRGIEATNGDEATGVDKATTENESVDTG